MSVMDRHLFPKVMTASGILAPAIVEIGNNGRVAVSGFAVETSSTDFISYPVAVLRRDAVDEFLFDDIDMILSDGWSTSTEKRLDDLFRSSGLYCDLSREAAGIIILLKPAGCEAFC